MPGYDERASILRSGSKIFQMVCDLATPQQWAEWLRLPLEHAARTANAELVDKLLKAGADGSAGWKGRNGQTLLHAGADGGKEQVMSALIRAGAREDVNTEADVLGRTPLHLAVVRGQVEAAKVLMMAGADVNKLDAKMNGPLHLAIMHGHAKLAEDLLLKGANPNLRSGDGLPPIHLAVRHGQDGLVSCLLHQGVDVNARMLGGTTALFIAVAEGRVSTAKLLMTWGADPTIEHVNNYTPLHLAVKRNSMKVFKALVQAGADIDTRNAKGITPLHVSANCGSARRTLALLERGANVNARSKNNSTPLHYACLRIHPDAADVLLRWGADETVVDSKERTPSSRIPAMPEGAEEGQSKRERLVKLLAFAPQDRAWRRRGFLVLCRAHPERLRLTAEIPDTAESAGLSPERSHRRPRREKVKVEITTGGAHSEGVGSSASAGGRAPRKGSRIGVIGEFDGVAAWLMGLTDKDIFRTIVGYL